MASEKPVKVEQERGTEAKIECTIRVVKKGDSVWATITFTNVGSTSIAMLKRNLILDGEQTWAAFEVTKDGARIPYRCLTIKAEEPKASDYREMKQGERIKTETNLSNCYDLSRPGQYTVQYRAINPHPETHELLVITSSALLFSIPLSE
jgi:peptidyl-Lys metalloendopeptidase